MVPFSFFCIWFLFPSSLSLQSLQHIIVIIRSRHIRNNLTTALCSPRDHELEVIVGSKQVKTNFFYMEQKDRHSIDEFSERACLSKAMQLSGSGLDCLRRPKFRQRPCIKTWSFPLLRSDTLCCIGSLWPIRWRKGKARKRKRRRTMHDIPDVSKEIQEVETVKNKSSWFRRRSQSCNAIDDYIPSSSTSFKFDKDIDPARLYALVAEGRTASRDTELSCRIIIDKATTIASTSASDTCSIDSYPSMMEMCGLGWGNWYSYTELEAATDGFSEHNIIGEGGYGVVYKGQVADGTVVAVKYLINKLQAGKEFMVEVEAIGRVRHKNLVRLLGYCAEDTHRILVYEYVNNGNLEEWLHGSISKYQTPSWDARMKIILGVAKALAYLHEALEPKVVHRDIKASNILLDSRWNAKVSDFGLAKILGCEKTHVMTRVMGTFGYVAPEYANTGLLNERSDIYSFGVLLMETVTGRDPVDYARLPGEVNLVDWLKVMVSRKRLEEVGDPRLEEKPSPRAVKKALITALQCVHPDVSRRPLMGQVVHMLEADKFNCNDNMGRGLWKMVQSENEERALVVQNLGKELHSLKLLGDDVYGSPNRSKRWQRYEA